MTKKINVKTLSFLLAFVMLFGVLLTPGLVKAQDADISTLKADSYIAATAGGIVADGDKYVTITTFGGTDPNTGIVHGNVVRGNIYLTYPNNTSVNLTAASVNLTAQKNFGFTLNGVTVAPGGNHTFTLDLTQSNVATLDVSPDSGNYEEGSYVITGGKVGDTVKVATSISVEKVKDWIESQKNVVPKPTDYAKAVGAVAGFDTIGEVDIYINKNETAMDALEKYGNMAGVNITGIPQGYISEMGVNNHNTLAAFDINSYSGWMYTVDEGAGWYFPNVGASGKTFTNDATMIWHFTLAYGSDIGAPWGDPGGNPGMPFSAPVERLMRSEAMSIADLIPQWANSGRVLEEIK